RTRSSSFNTQTRWSHGDDQLPLPGRPLGQVILQRRVQRLHLPTPAASLHLRPPGHPSRHHTASRAALRSRGGREPPRPVRPPPGRGKALKGTAGTLSPRGEGFGERGGDLRKVRNHKVLVAGLTPPATRHSFPIHGEGGQV